MKKIALIYMGGTFGCIGDPLAPMSAVLFLPLLQRVLPPQLNIDCFTAPSIQDSSACTAIDWLELCQYIQALQQQDYQHFVVLHGTDTLSYAGAVLSHVLQQSCHVILTGSQYPLLNTQGSDIREFTDALDNLNTALHHIATVAAGVYVSFYQKTIHARTAIKIHSTALDAFYGQTLDQPLKQAVLAHPTTVMNITAAHLEKAQKLNIINMMLMPITPQVLNHNLQNLTSSVPDFLILQAYGVGNLAVNSDIIERLLQLKQLGCLVVLSSQVPFGGLDQRYAISQWTQDCQILISDALSPTDLYAKILKTYLQYDTPEQCYAHWYASSE